MKKFRDLVSELRAVAPPLLPVRVYLRDMKRTDDCVGFTELVYGSDGKASHFKIVVHKAPGWTYIRLVLLHEWAHALAWHEGHEVVEDHGPEWAIAFSRLYQQFIEL